MVMGAIERETPFRNHGADIDKVGDINVDDQARMYGKALNAPFSAEESMANS